MNLINNNFTSLIPNAFKTENVSLFLHSLIKCTRPLTIIEIGCGYSTLFLSEAIKDIKFENLKANQYYTTDDYTDNFINYSGGFYCPKFYVVDNFQHPHSTQYRKILNDNNLSQNISFYEMDVSDFIKTNNDNFDLIWLDYGLCSNGDKMTYNHFMNKLSPGGYMIIHSTITNYMSRLFVTELKLKLSSVDYEIMSFVEPHKTNQNSFTVVKKLIDYPIYSVEP